MYILDFETKTVHANIDLATLTIRCDYCADGRATVFNHAPLGWRALCNPCGHERTDRFNSMVHAADESSAAIDEENILVPHDAIAIRSLRDEPLWVLQSIGSRASELLLWLGRAGVDCVTKFVESESCSLCEAISDRA